MKYHVIVNARGDFYRGRKLGWTPFLQEALLITDLDIIPDLLCWDEKYMRIESFSIGPISNGKSLFQWNSKV